LSDSLPVGRQAKTAPANYAVTVFATPTRKSRAFAAACWRRTSGTPFAFFGQLKFSPPSQRLVRLRRRLAQLD